MILTHHNPYFGIFFSGHNPDLIPYCDLFLENHISGKILLNLTIDNLKNLGIKSLGHALDLFVSIQ